MIDIVELKKMRDEDSLGMGQVVLPILEFFDFLIEIKNFKSDLEAQDFFKNYVLLHESEMILEFEKNKDPDATTFADIASLPLKKLCDELSYSKKDELLQRYKYLIASMLIARD